MTRQIPRQVTRTVLDEDDEFMTPGEVAALFRVDPKTVTRWAAAGKLRSIKTPGGHRRFRMSDVKRLLNGEVEFGDTMKEVPNPLVNRENADF